MVAKKLEKLIIEPMPRNCSSANDEIVHSITFYNDILGSNQSEMWQTNFSGKQFRYHSNPKCEHKHNIAKANLM